MGQAVGVRRGESRPANCHGGSSGASCSVTLTCLSEVDYGTSCLVVGAVAGLAWLRRSLPLAAIVAVG